MVTVQVILSQHFRLLTVLGLLNFSTVAYSKPEFLEILSSGVSVPGAVCVDGPEVDDFHRCAYELCPNPYQPPVTTKSSKFSESQLENLKVALGKFLEFKKGQLLEIEAAWEGKKIKASQPSEQDLEVLAAMFFRPFLKITVDKAKPLSERLRYEFVKLPANLTPELLEASKDWLGAYNSSPIVETTLIMNAAFTEDEAQELLRKKSRKILGDQERLKQIQAYNPMLISKLQLAESGKFEDPVDDLLKQVHFMENPYGGAGNPTGTVDLYCKGKCQENLALHTKKRKLQQIQSWKKDVQSASPEEYLKKCSAKVEVTQEYLAKISAIESELPQIKEKVGKSIQRFCPNRKDAQQFISGIKVSYNVDDKKDLSTFLQSELRGLQESKKDLEKVYVEMSTGGALNDVEELCRFNGDFVADSWDPTNKVLNVGPMACLHEGGKGIISHEIGHGLSSFMKALLPDDPCRIKYEALRSCVTKRHVDVNSANQGYPFLGMYNFPADKHHTEEDMADYISALSMGGSEKNSYLCAILHYDPVKMKYSPRTVPGDTHSPDLTRILWGLRDQGKKLPDVCEKFNQQSTEEKWQRCE